MDAKVTLSFNGEVINKAKKFADAHNISLSRLTEFLYGKLTNGHYQHLEDIPLADWVSALAEGKVEYRIKPRSRKLLKQEYYKTKK